MSLEWDVVVWGAAVRAVQAFIEASPTYVFGLILVGVMRHMIGTVGTRRVFAGEGWRGLARAWVLGMLLPVCSLGVLPVASEMRRAGVRGGNILAFVMVAPLLNPLSLLYGLTLGEPVIVLSFGLASLFLALGAGALWEWLCPSHRDEGYLAAVDAAPMPAPGPRRLLAVLTTAAREAVGPTLAYMLLAAAAAGLIAALIPNGVLQRSMRHDDWTSPLLMAAVTSPLFMGPLPAMMRIGMMFDHGNSVGAAFVLLVLGCSLNIGKVAWTIREFGVRPALIWVTVMSSVSLGFAYAAEPTLYRAAKEEDHTHAFDDFTNPFAGGPVAWSQAREKALSKAEVLEPLALGIMMLLMLLGGGLRLSGREAQLDAFLLRSPPPRTRPPTVWERPVPRPVLAAVAVLGLLAFSVVGVYIYYPAPKVALDDMARVRADAVIAVRTGQRDEGIRRLEQWDLVTRKLQVGAIIRSGRFDAEQAAHAEELREALEEVRDYLLANDPAKAKAALERLETAYQQCKRSFTP